MSSSDKGPVLGDPEAAQYTSPSLSKVIFTVRAVLAAVRPPTADKIRGAGLRSAKVITSTRMTPAAFNDCCFENEAVSKIPDPEQSLEQGENKYALSAVSIVSSPSLAPIAGYDPHSPTCHWRLTADT